jgi:hypothetical protein
MLPADKDVPTTCVVLNNILNTLRVIPVTRRVDSQTQVLSQRLDGVVGTLALAICERQSYIFPILILATRDWDWTHHFQESEP